MSSTTGTEKKESLSRADSMALKGIAIIMLVFYHCFVSGKTLSEYGVNTFPLSRSFAGQLISYFKICVPVFAFISGYGLYQSFIKTEKETLVKWEISRIIKTLSGLWFAFVVFLIFFQIHSGVPQKLYFKEGIVKGIVYTVMEAFGMAHLFGTPTATVTWWYMGAAVVYIVLLPFLAKAAEKFGYFSVTAVIVFLPRLLNTGCPGSMSPYTFLLAFVGGMAFSQYRIFEKAEKWKLMKNENQDAFARFLLSILILCFSFKAYNYLKWSVFWELQFAICPVIFICFCKKYILNIPVLRQVWIFLGKYSMNIFLIHSLIKNRLCKEFLYSFKSFWVIPLVLLVISLVVSIAFEKIKRLLSYEKAVQKLTEKICRLTDNIAA